MTRHLLRTVVCALLLSSSQVHADVLRAAPAIPAQVSNAAWEQDMQRFAASDARQPPPRHGIVFVGSSSIRFWETLAQDFPGKPVINRGFGGSEMADSAFYADRIVIPYAPRLVVVYAGENDIAAGKSPATVLADFQAFRRKVHAALPQTRIIYLAIKESPVRARVRPEVLAANKLLAIIENAEYILSIEWMAATQAHDFIQSVAARAPGTDALYGLLRTHVAPYSDDRPPSADIEAIRSLMSQNTPPN